MSSPVQQISTLSTLQNDVVAAFAKGRTVTAAASAAGLHRATIYNWLKHDAAFAAAVRQAKEEYAANLRDQLKELSALALYTLGSILDDPSTPPGVRLKTALAILQRPQLPEQGWALPEPLNSQPEEQHIPEGKAALPKAAAEPTKPEEFPAKSPQSIRKIEPIPPQENIARNAPCPCGSGQKFKRCCGRGAPAVMNSNHFSG